MANLFNWFKKDQAKNEPETTEKQAHEALEGDTKNATDAVEIDAEQVSSEHPPVEQTETQLDIVNTDPNLTSDVTPESDITVQPELQNSSVSETLSEDEISDDPIKNAPIVDAEEQNLQSVDSFTAEKPTSVGFFSRLRQSLSRTKESIGTGFVSLFAGKKIDSDLYEELETQLLIADVGITTTTKIINSLTESAKLSQLKNGDALYDLLKEQMKALLEPVSKPLDLTTQNDENGNKEPFVILMIGVNGVGKTTTIGKLAKQFQREGKKVMLAAGDTFRAAAVEQLQVWGERNNIPVVAQQTGSDSASVIFDALASAKAKGVDVLIADTAGRLQNKNHLIEELKKVVRVMKKINPNAPHEVMLTLDASTGQNAVSQTKIFNEAVGISGINLTKLDGTAKGGIIFSLADQFGIPIRYIGIGEGIDDLRPFEAQQFVDALFSQDITEQQ
jgi:fused signal recognition particle receptor